MWQPGGFVYVMWLYPCSHAMIHLNPALTPPSQPISARPQGRWRLLLWEMAKNSDVDMAHWPVSACVEASVGAALLHRVLHSSGLCTGVGDRYVDKPKLCYCGELSASLATCGMRGQWREGREGVYGLWCNFRFCSSDGKLVVLVIEVTKRRVKAQMRQACKPPS